MERLVTYKITSEEAEEGIDLIAVTKNPAIIQKGVMLSAIERNFQSKAVMLKEEERMIIAGPAIIPDLEIYRRDEDGHEYNVVFTKQEIVNLVKDLVAKKDGSIFNVEHTERSAPLFLYQHWIIEEETMQASVKQRFGLDLPIGTWFIMAQVTDKEFWEKEVKSKEMFGFSIEGLLGLNLNKQDKMSVKRKFKHRFVATKRAFDGAVASTEAGDELIVAADNVAVGEAVVVVDETLTPDEAYTGDVMIDDQVVTIADGEITAVEPAPEAEEMEDKPKEDEPKEDVKEEELADEAKTDEEKKEEDAKLADEPVVEAPAAEKVLDEAGVVALIDAKLKEVYDALAEMKAEMADKEATVEGEPVELTAVERKFQALEKIGRYLNR